MPAAGVLRFVQRKIKEEESINISTDIVLKIVGLNLAIHLAGVLKIYNGKAVRVIFTDMFCSRGQTIHMDITDMSENIVSSWKSI